MSAGRRRERGSGGHVSRREFLVRGSAVAGGVALGSTFLGSSALASLGSQGDVGGKLSVLNWPLYIDTRKKSQKNPGSPTAFQKATGIDLKYSESLNDNNEFFAKYQRQFSQHQYPGFDIAVPSSWMAKRLIGLKYVQKLPLDQIPNAKNLVPAFQNPPWDPTGEYTLPWQAGMTGLAYNIKITGRELHSIDDLFDPKFKNKVGMLLEMRDTVGLAALAEGIDPSTITYKKAQPAFKRLQKAVDSGQVRRFTGNDYQDDLVNGNFAVCIGWSGDVSQLTLDNPDLKFVIPDEGGMRWADIMTYIATAKRRDQVSAWMNYFYHPLNAAYVESYIGYISPVAGIAEPLATIDPRLANSPLLFPPEDVLSQLKVFNQELSPKDEEQFDRRFSELTGT
jgi:spermidine/putrescine transport system substrate-binding protein